MLSSDDFLYTINKKRATWAKAKDLVQNVYLKESARKSLNNVLREYNLGNCDDSTSSLTSKRIYFKSGNSTEFSIDVCITSVLY